MSDSTSREIFSAADLEADRLDVLAFDQSVIFRWNGDEGHTVELVDFEVEGLRDALTAWLAALE